MKEHPIIFTGPMVRAILDGRKTQTRRVVNPQPELNGGGWLWSGGAGLVRIGHDCGYIHTDLDTLVRIMEKACRYQIGDRLWVKETFAVESPTCPVFAADQTDLTTVERWSPSIFMPRKLSRITLEITHMRVERVQNISEEDAQAEGAVHWWLESKRDHLRDSKAKTCFELLWNAVNGKKAPWANNPWVWAITFKETQTLWEQRCGENLCL